MGFARPKVTTPETVSTPPVVTENTESESATKYEQQASRRKGLLSTILSNRRSMQGDRGGNSTLG